jgi:energy-coupling factor transporter ATP-binding protein EcfA2
MQLRLEGIGYAHGGEPVLSGLSLDPEAGEWLAIIGANGSGRSTLAEIATGLRRPQHGRVLVDGHDIAHPNGRRLRRRLGLVMQRAEDQFLGDTVYDDIAFGPAQRSRDPEEIRVAVSQALELVGFDLDEIGSRSPLEFSGGQRRRLAVAAILALKPVVLVLDEPFAGLDGEARSDMVTLLSALRSAGGMTIVTLTSDIDSAAGASRMALLLQGQIGLIGDLGDFVANQELCRQAGIVLPEPIRLALALRDRGWNVPVLGSEGALEAAITAEWRQRRRA